MTLGPFSSVGDIIGVIWNSRDGDHHMEERQAKISFGGRLQRVYNKGY